ncbi:MAG: GC-type dockerin domain-anchored protein [Phycisphaerales bacterium]
MTRLTTCVTLALAAGAAFSAPKVYLSSTNGGVYELDTSYTPVLLGSPGGVINGIIATRTELVTVDHIGVLQKLDPLNGAVAPHAQLWHGIAGSAITNNGNQVFVSDSAGNIVYFDENGDEVNTYYAGLEVSAMLVDGDNLVIGSPNTFILSAPFGDPNFQFISACGGIVNSLALTDTHLFAGDANGTVYRFTADGGAYETTFATTTDAKGVAVFEGELLVAGSDGTLEFRDPISGALLDTAELGIPVSGIVVANLCPADISADGNLDVDDVDGFVAAFLGADMALADCNASGELNIDDVDCFVASFLAGCP